MSEILHSPDLPRKQRSLLAPMLVSALDEEAQEFLRHRSTPRKFGHDQLIQQRGDRAEGVWWIESGAVTVGQFLPDGEFRRVALLGPGDSYGELALFSGRPRVVDAISRGESALRFIPARAMEELFAARPDTAQVMLGAMAQQLQEMLDVVAGMRRGTSVTRVAGLLANLSADSGADADINITQQELGELLGLTRATVNQALAALELGGAIRRSYGKLSVIDREALALAALS